MENALWPLWHLVVFFVFFFFVKLVFGCSKVSDRKGRGVLFKKEGNAFWKQYEMRKSCGRENLVLDLSYFQLRRVALWATAAPHLWSVQGTGFGSKWIRDMFIG